MLRGYLELILTFLLVLLFIGLSTNKLLAQKSLDTATYETAKLEIPQLKRQRTIQIYLPKSYALSHKRYPVIYLQDGQNIFIKGAENGDNWYADSLVNLMPADKQCILVAIHAGTGNNRMNEYNPYLSNNEGVIYADYLARVVKHYIDTNYRTKADAKHTAIVGSSMGGLISMYTAAKYGEGFGVAGIFSPAFWYATNVFADITRRPIPTRSRIFLACGDAEGNETEYVNRMDSILLHKKFNRKHVPVPLVIKGGKHDEKQWRTAFEAFYNWFVDSL